MATARAMISRASQPRCRLCTPSSRSIISSARLRAAALTTAAGWCSLAISSLTRFLSNEKAPPAVWTGLSKRRRLLELDALLGEVTDGGRMPRDRGGLHLLVL